MQHRINFYVYLEFLEDVYLPYSNPAQRYFASKTGVQFSAEIQLIALGSGISPEAKRRSPTSRIHNAGQISLNQVSCSPLRLCPLFKSNCSQAPWGYVSHYFIHWALLWCETHFGQKLFITYRKVSLLNLTKRVYSVWWNYTENKIGIRIISF